MRLHIRCLKLVILSTRMIIIPPDTRCAISIYTAIVRESIFLRIIEDFAHESVHIVYHRCYLFRATISFQFLANLIPAGASTYITVL